MVKDNKTRYYILCSIATALTALCLILVPFFAFATVASTLSNGNGSVTPGSMVTMMILSGGGFVISLVLAIIAIVTDKRKAWGVVCIVVDSLLVIVGAVLMAILMSSAVMATKGMREYLGSQYEVEITNSIPDDIRTCMEKHDFDVAEMTDDYDSPIITLELHLYVSRNASKEKIDDATLFLKELRELCDNYGGSVRVYPCSFDPDDEDSFVYPYSYHLDSRSIEKNFDLNRNINNARDFMDPEHGHVPEHIEEGDMLIVIY